MIESLIFVFLITIQLIIFFVIIFLLKKAQLLPILKLLFFKKGSLVIKFRQDNSCELLLYKKPVTEILWKINTPKGEKKFYQKILKVEHTLANTSIPLHICPYNSPTNVNVVSNISSPLSIDSLNYMINYAYMQGVADSRNILKTPNTFSPKLLLLGLAVLIILFGIIFLNTPK